MTATQGTSRWAARGQIALTVVAALACSGPGVRPPSDGPAPPGADDGGAGGFGFRDVSDTHLPLGVLGGRNMDALALDVDGDGDLDLMIAHEFESNLLLINDGQGRFTDESEARIPSDRHDSEDIGASDFDGDGDLDIVIVSEDDVKNEYYLNRGDGRFTAEPERFPVDGVSNGLVVGDIDGDGDDDLIIANNGQNVVLVSDGRGGLVDDTAARLPARDDISQDVELGDIDGDGDLDLLVGNEDDNRLLINDGEGRFRDADPGALPLRDSPEETRDVHFGDIDGDGDLDIFIGNVRFFVDGAVREDRLLVNDGQGRYTDDTSARLPQHPDSTVDGDFVDLDGDGDLDLVLGNTRALQTAVRFRALINDGSGRFVDDTERLFPPTAVGRCFDVEAGDFNGDGRVDLYFVNRGDVDRLLLAN